MITFKLVWRLINDFKTTALLIFIGFRNPKYHCTQYSNTNNAVVSLEKLAVSCGIDDWADSKEYYIK